MDENKVVNETHTNTVDDMRNVEKIEAMINRDMMKNFKLGDLKEIDGLYFKIIDIKQLKKRIVLEHVIVRKKTDDKKESVNDAESKTNC